MQTGLIRDTVTDEGANRTGTSTTDWYKERDESYTNSYNNCWGNSFRNSPQEGHTCAVERVKLNIK